jgi:hypothetical protein
VIVRKGRTADLARLANDYVGKRKAVTESGTLRTWNLKLETRNLKLLTPDSPLL